MSVSYVELRGKLGAPAAGATITLQRSSGLGDATGRQRFPPEPQQVIADAGGGWSITAVANDSAGLGPAGSYYALTIDRPGGSRNRYRIELNAAGGAVQYIAALALGTDPLASRRTCWPPITLMT